MTAPQLGSVFTAVIGQTSSMANAVNTLTVTVTPSTTLDNGKYHLYERLRPFLVLLCLDCGVLVQLQTKQLDPASHQALRCPGRSELSVQHFVSSGLMYHIDVPH
jgi:hypothetical protein